jgi:hypothetical protein
VDRAPGLILQYDAAIKAIEGEQWNNLRLISVPDIINLYI